MLRSNYRKFALQIARIAVALALTSGCGATRTTDTARTATEQLLISDAIDRAVQEVDFQPLAGQTVYLDTAALKDVTDRNYLVSTLRQHLLANGCTLRDNREEADFVVEARAGAIGTDRNDLLFGIPATNVPQILPFQGVPAAIPEVPLAKRRDQRGVAKLSMFAYHRASGTPVWQSGLAVRESSSNDVWVFGAGPFEHGTVQKSKLVAAQRAAKTDAARRTRGDVNLAQRKVFTSPTNLVQQFRRLPKPVEVAAAQSPATSVAATAPSALPATPFPNLPPLHFERQAKPQLPYLAETVTSLDGEPKLTGRVFSEQMLRRDSTRTITSTPAPAPVDNADSDVVPLPQPRFDSL
jgi:hypothetical protein